jgi:hypothetical protein
VRSADPSRDTQPSAPALLIEERGVLVPDDMLSDLFIPMLDDFNSTNDPIEDYVIGLRLLEGGRRRRRRHPVTFRRQS